MPGKYGYVALARTVGERKPAAAASIDAKSAGAAMDMVEKAPECSLSPEVQEFVRNIFDVSMMTKRLQEASINLDKMPIGSLSAAQMDKGYEILREISTLLVEGPLQDDEQVLAIKLLDCSNRFYATIPHTWREGTTPPVIADLTQLKLRVDTLETLAEIQTAILLSKEKSAADVHPLDANYGKLGCNLVALAPASAEYKMIATLVQNGYSQHNNAGSKLSIKQVFEIDRAGETERFAPWAQDAKRKLLWHGSGLQNWVGILSQGLRIAPPEAPAAGYNFGKGVYFADMLEKAFGYCRATGGEAVLQLSEVALGESYVLTAPEYAAAENSKQAAKQSTFCIGKTQPDPAQDRDAAGVAVSVGKAVANEYDILLSMTHNEFIVYDEAQVKARYIVCLCR